MKPAWFAALVLPFVSLSLSYPQASPPTTPAQTPPSSRAKAAPSPEAAPITEAELRQRLLGRPLYLRGLYLDENLHFNMKGDLVGQSKKGSWTLCAVVLDHVKITAKKVELEGVRYGIHFEDEGSWAEQATSFDRIQITPKKKHLVIEIDRQVVVKPKKEKGGKKGREQQKSGGDEAAETAEKPTLAPGETFSPGESAEHLRAALNRIFAPELDAKMIAEMPDYWQYFFQAQNSHKMLEPTDAKIVRPGPGVNGPHLVAHVTPGSNDYAQKADVAGVASYMVILGADGRPAAVAVYRPIGFGLDENAVAAIENAKFTPAVKDGKAVMSVIDLAVNFRIYSKRTEQAAPAEAAETSVKSMPGPYTSEAHQ
ncbi:MAG: energy transducer TonB [Acidobacteriaceae bacterium]